MAPRNNLPKEEASDKKSKPKSIVQVTFTVRDDGTITSDFWVWDEDEYGRRKKWTVSGEDAIKFLKPRQPNNIRVLASMVNLQVALAGYPEEQGPWITVGKDGKLAGTIKPLNKIGSGEMDNTAKSPVGNGMGEKLGEAQESRDVVMLGLPPKE